MNIRAARGAVIALLCATPPIFAAAPDTSLLPVPRPITTPLSEPTTTLAILSQALRPDAMVLATRAPGLRISLRPHSRPPTLDTLRRASPAPLTQVMASRPGSICGIRGIQGRALAPIKGRLRGCGIKSPVQITAVAGVALTQPATMDCTTAKALNKWVRDGVIPIVGRRGGGVASLQVVAHYSCRTRNSQPGAKISEHGKGHAIDISAINLNNGSALTVLSDWKKRTEGKLLKKIHRAACGPFGTVLGPNADRFHQDHFHLDTARYRGGSYCR